MNIGRTQTVVVEGAASEWIPLVSGVPQGSALDPIFFLYFLYKLDV